VGDGSSATAGAVGSSVVVGAGRSGALATWVVWVEPPVLKVSTQSWPNRFPLASFALPEIVKR
jgi:hypothetical protein